MQLDSTVSESITEYILNLIIKNLVKHAPQLGIYNSKVHSLLQLCIASYLGHAYLKSCCAGLINSKVGQSVGKKLK